MTLYFDFEEQRRTAEVIWPESSGTIHVNLLDVELLKKLPSDLIFDMNRRNKISFIEENPDNKRLVQLQRIIGRRLQELANKL
jgi:hypothetical protein